MRNIKAVPTSDAKSKRWRLTTLLLLGMLLGHQLVMAFPFHPKDHIYQYQVQVGTSTAYLWIPPDCIQIRGVLIALDNMLERRWLEDPIIRRCAQKQNLAIVWVGPAEKTKNELLGDKSNINADMDKGSGAALDKMFRDFAAVSGYAELANVPLIPMGHSAHGQFAWKVAEWNPERVIAAIAVKTIPLPDRLSLGNVPLCYMVGQTTEWPQYRDGRKGDRDFFWPVVRNSAVALRQKNPDNRIGVVVDPGGGHFDWSSRQATFMALYITKACAARLPTNNFPQGYKGKIVLRNVTTASGWLTDTGGMHPDKFAPASYGTYLGDKNAAYWFFDEQLARAAVAFEGDRKIRKKQMVSFVQDSQVLGVAKQGFASVKFQPQKDGLTFSVKGGYLSEIPMELEQSGTKLGHGRGPIHFNVITGPVVQLGPRKFKVAFDRAGGGNIWIEATKKQAGIYRHSVQPGQWNIPDSLRVGKTQSIEFPDLKDILVGTKPVALRATSDSGLPVGYYITSGPAIIKGNRLYLTKVPVRSKYPVQITVVAYQWGRTIAPCFQTAAKVQRIFYLTK